MLPGVITKQAFADIAAAHELLVGCAEVTMWPESVTVLGIVTRAHMRVTEVTVVTVEPLTSADRGVCRPA